MAQSTYKLLRQAVERLDDVPVCPDALRAAYHIARNTPEDIASLTLIAWSDPGLAVMLMARSKAHTLADAMSQLGPEHIRAIAHEQLVRAVLDNDSTPTFPMERGWLDASLLAAIASEHFAVALDTGQVEEAYLAGLLADIGRLCLKAIPAPPADPIGHSTSALAGKWALKHFGFAQGIVDAVWLQHVPADSLPNDADGVQLVDLVAVARALVEDPVADRILNSDDISHRLQRLGLDVTAATGIWQEAMASFHTARKRLLQLKADTPDQRPELAADLDQLIVRCRQLEHAQLLAQETQRRTNLLSEFEHNLLVITSQRELLAELARTAQSACQIAPGLCYVLDADVGSVHGRSWHTPDELANEFYFANARASDEQGLLRHIKTLQLLGGAHGEGMAQGLIAVPIRDARAQRGQIVLDVSSVTTESLQRDLDCLLALSAAAGAWLTRNSREERLNDLVEAWAEHMAMPLPSANPLSMTKPAMTETPKPDPVHTRPLEAGVTTSEPDIAPTREPLEPAAIEETPAAATPQPEVAPGRQLNLEPALLNFTLRQVSAEFGALANVREVRLTHEFAEGLPRVRIDKSRFRLALRSLLRGLIELCAPSGEIRVTSSVNNARSVVTAEFEARTGPNTPVSDSNQSPIDMRAIQAILELHGGKISLTTTAHNAATITISLPAAAERAIMRSVEPTPAKAAPAIRETSTGDKHVVLIVEENHDLREVLAETLHSRNLEVHKATSTSDGLDLCRRMNFDLVLLDLPQHRSLGKERLGEFSEMCGDSPLLVIVNAASPQEIQDFVKFGAAACISKPFELAELLSQVGKILGRRPIGVSHREANKQSA